MQKSNQYTAAIMLQNFEHLYEAAHGEPGEGDGREMRFVGTGAITLDRAELQLHWTNVQSRQVRYESVTVKKWTVHETGDFVEMLRSFCNAVDFVLARNKQHLERDLSQLNSVLQRHPLALPVNQPNQLCQPYQFLHV